MRIFRSFLVLFTVAILLSLPVAEGIVYFRTNLRTDPFYTAPVAGASTVTLSASLYQDDMTRLSVISDSAIDNPVAASYNTTNRSLIVSGLSGSSNRTLDVTYPVNNSLLGGGVSGLLDRLQWIWLACVLAFVPAAIVAIFAGNKNR